MHELKSSIDRVKLYHQGATVYRVAQLELEADSTTTLELPGLPIALSDGSVKLRATDHSAQVLCTDLRVGLHVKPQAEPLESPDEQELKSLRRQLVQRQHQRDALLHEQHIFESIKLPVRPRPLAGTPPVASPMKARVALELTTHKAIETRHEAIRRLRAEMESLTRQIQQREDALRRVSQAQQASANQVSKTALATIINKSKDKLKVSLELEYFVDGARWAPQYQCRIARDGSRASIIMRAVVNQASGEDWRGVQLQLSTAAPMSWTALPKLNSMRIGKAQAPPQTSRGFRAPPMGAASLFDDLDHAYQRAKRALPGHSGWHPPQVHSPSLQMPDLSALFEELADSDLYADSAPQVAYAREEYEESADYAMDKEMSVGGSYAEMSMPAVAASAMAPPPAPAPQRSMPSPRPGAPPMLERSEGRARKSKKMSSAVDSFGSASLSEDMDELDDLLEELNAMIGGSQLNSADFSMLTLGEPTGGTRGKLMPSAAIDRYRKSLERSGLTINFQLESLIQTHQSRAMSALQTPMPSGTKNVRQAAGQFDYVYTTRDRVDVPSDGAFHSIPVDEREATCALHYVVVPREDTQVYRVASLENPTTAPLLAGPAELYVADEFILTTQLPTVAPRSSFKLGLGVEQAIKCARNTSFEEKRSGQAVVATSELWHTIEIELINRLSAPVQCEVRERIPQPAKDAEVVIEVASVEPGWRDYDQIERGTWLVGGRRWQVELAPSKPTVLKAQYVVKIYANNEIVGGNRREQ